jgi:hypothetical protein
MRRRGLAALAGRAAVAGIEIEAVWVACRRRRGVTRHQLRLVILDKNESLCQQRRDHSLAIFIRHKDEVGI